ncbi:WG repeat-containing protein [Salegentibacter sp. F14]
MRDFKIIVGLLLIGFSLFTFGNTYDQYKGEEIYGALTTFILLILVGVALIYSTQHKKIQEEKRKEKAYLRERAIINEISEKEENLINLRDKGILSEGEFKSKISKIHQDKAYTELEKTKEYQQLKQLYNSGVLTKEEYDSKVKILIEKQNSDLKAGGLKSKLENTEYHQISQFKENRGRIWDKNQLFGFIDENYDTIVEPKYTIAEDFNEGLALVMLYDNYGFINKKGDIVIHLQYEFAKSFENGVAKVRLGKEEFYINKTGQEVAK